MRVTVTRVSETMQLPPSHNVHNHECPCRRKGHVTERLISFCIARVYSLRLEIGQREREKENEREKQHHERFVSAGAFGQEIK